jgi:hypothetical protein
MKLVVDEGLHTSLILSHVAHQGLGGETPGQAREIPRGILVLEGQAGANGNIIKAGP